MCGRRIKPKPNRKRCAECQHQHRIEINRKYNESHKEQHKQYRESHKEHYRELSREWEKRNKEKRKEYDREYRQRNRERIQRYQRLYSVYYALRHPFRHTHDRSIDLRIENGRVKGAVWLESQRHKTDAKRFASKIKNLGLSYGKALCNCGSLETPFLVAIENHRRYCFECGGKISIAFENEYYTITEVVCSFCGLVLPQTTP